MRHNSSLEFGGSPPADATFPSSPPAGAGGAASVDVSSPYFGRSNPFSEPAFGELAPEQLREAGPRHPAPPPPGPPMRSHSGK